MPRTLPRRLFFAGLRSASAFLGVAALIGAPLVMSAGTASASPTFASISSVSCPSTTECLATGAASFDPSNFNSSPGVLYSSDGGEQWDVGKLPSTTGFSGIYGVTCVSTTTCYAVESSSAGDSGQLLSTTNASSKSGPTWTAHALPQVDSTPFSSVNSVTCPSSSECYVAGAADRGSDPAVVKVSLSRSKISFSVAALPALETGEDYPNTLRAVSCSSTSECVALGWNSSRAGGFRFVDGRWVLITSLPTAYTMSLGVDCVAKSSDCYATFSAGENATPELLESTNAGDSWTKQDIPTSSLSALTGISCVSTSQCAAVGTNSSGSNAVITKTKGSKFTLAKSPASQGPMYAVNCVSTKVCAAGGSTSSNTDAQMLRTKNFTAWKSGALA